MLAATKLFNIADESLHDYKSKLFATCLTELTQGQNVLLEFPYHWSRYSNGGDGVALEFEFGPKYKEPYSEDPVLFPFYHLMKVQYHDILEKDETIVRFKNEIEKIRVTSGFNEHALLEFLSPFLCAYKREKEENETFNSENEIRLLYSASEDLRGCKFYGADDNNDEETFVGIERDIYRPFRQLPFNTSKTFLKLNLIHLGDGLNHIDKSSVIKLAAEAGIPVENGEKM